MDFMQLLTGLTEEKIAADLHGVIFRVPAPPGNEPVYQAADEYLSGKEILIAKQNVKLFLNNGRTQEFISHDMCRDTHR